VCRAQVRASSPDTLDAVGQLTPVFLAEINNTLNMAAQTGEQREKQAELQGQLCGVLQVCACWLAMHASCT
jgi:importin subunit beta-1